jgi:hypothetical protein
MLSIIKIQKYALTVSCRYSSMHALTVSYAHSIHALLALPFLKKQPESEPSPHYRMDTKQTDTRPRTDSKHVGKKKSRFGMNGMKRSTSIDKSDNSKRARTEITQSIEKHKNSSISRELVLPFFCGSPTPLPDDQSLCAIVLIPYALHHTTPHHTTPHHTTPHH